MKLSAPSPLIPRALRALSSLAILHAAACSGESVSSTGTPNVPDAGDGLDASIQPDSGEPPPDASTDASIGPDGSTEPDASDESPPIPAGWTKRWPPAAAPLCDMQTPTAVTVHGGYAFVGTSCGEVFRSSDIGKTWEPVPTPATPKMQIPAGSPAPYISDFATHGGSVFVGYRGSGVYQTGDDGGQWSAFNNGLSAMFSKSILHMHVVGSTLYLATFGAGVYASSVDAASFIPVNTETSDPSKMSPTSTCPNSPGYVDPVTMKPMSFLHGLALTDDGVYLYYSNKCGGVYRTPLADLPQKSAWEGFGSGLPFFFSYYQDPYAMLYDGAYLFAGIDDEGAYRTDAQKPANWTWVSQEGLINGNGKLDPISFLVTGGVVYMGTRFGGAYATTTHGSPWTDLNNLPGGKLGGAADSVFSLAHDAAHIYAATDTGFYVSN